MKKAITLFFAAALTALSSWVMAQPYPTKPIKLLVPYAPGGTTDIMARTLQEPMQKSLGQPIIVENKSGGAGTIAMREAGRAAADGYTLVFVNSGQVSVTPVVQKDAGYDALKDFAPVGLVSMAPMFVVINAAVPANDLRGFIEYARKQPNGVEYASAGPGSFGHLSSELLARTAGIKLVHIPYKGQAPTTNAVMTGEVKLLITTPSAAMNSHIASGKLRLLAVGSGEPSPLAPGAPTVSSVLPGYKAETWFALLAPAGTPPEIVAKLNDALGKALALADLQQRFTNFGLIAKASTPQQLRDMMAEDAGRWGPVVRELGIKAE